MTSIQNTNTLPYFVKTVLEKVNGETKEALPIMQLPIHGDKPQILPYPLPSKVLPDGIFGKKEPAEIKLPELPLKQELKQMPSINYNLNKHSQMSRNLRHNETIRTIKNSKQLTRI